MHVLFTELFVVMHSPSGSVCQATSFTPIYPCSHSEAGIDASHTSTSIVIKLARVCLCGVYACGVARAWRGVAWRGVAWRGVAWRGVAWRGVAWRGVAWRGVAWRGVYANVYTIYIFAALHFII